MRTTKRKGNGWILYEGPSQLDGTEIVAIATGSRVTSKNRKTGPMLQTWMLNANVHPHEAIIRRLDTCVCGDCGFKLDDEGNRICYVKPMPLGQIYNQYRDGRYPITPNYSQGLNARIGSYGDPTAVPIKVWLNLIANVPAATGYTRQWQQQQFQDFRHFCMASCFNDEESQYARALGWKAYTIRPVAQPSKPLNLTEDPSNAQRPSLVKEVDCPAAKLPNQITCNSCKLCDGQKTNVSVVVHGIGKKTFLI